MKDQVTAIIIGILAIFLVLGTYSLIVHIVNIPESPQIDPDINQEDLENIKNENSFLNHFRELKKLEIYKNGLVTPVDLVTACVDGKKEKTSCNEEIAKITKSIITEGEITEAYLYIKAGVSRDQKPLGPLTQYDSIWFFVDSSNSGGHLLRSKALVRQQSEEGYSELLFDLKKAPFTKLPYVDNSNPEKVVNILPILGQEGRHFTGGFVSTLGYGKIIEMTIGYNGEGRIFMLEN